MIGCAYHPLRVAVVRGLLKQRNFKTYSSGSSIFNHQARSLNYFCKCVTPSHFYINDKLQVGRFNSKVNLDYYSAVLVVARPIHTTGSVGEEGESGRPSSKVEQTVKTLEKELEKTKQGQVQLEKRPLWKRVQDEVKLDVLC